VKQYEVPLVPGPTTVPGSVLEAYLVDYGSADLEPEYLELYGETQAALQQIMRTGNSMAMMSGEGMVALWGALKSCVRPGERVLAVANGIFGAGIGEMARQIGADVEFVNTPFDQAFDPQQVADAVRRFRPKLVTTVHCETPSGLLNPVGSLADLLPRDGRPLLYVDAVSSIGGTPVEVDAWGIDLCLFGSQKCLAAPPNMAAVTVSPRAWEAIAEVNYPGYDALQPWRTALADAYFPYTPSWHDTAALAQACRLLVAEGFENAFARHASVAAQCRRRLKSLGLRLYPANEADSSPTVTAVWIPGGLAWSELDGRLRRRGMVVGGSYGPLAGRIFRIGHMGTQADANLVERGMDILAEALK